MSFQEEITPIVEDLLYPSESDEPIEHIHIETEQSLPFSIENLLSVLDHEDTTHIEELAIDQFWENIIVPKQWYGEHELLRTKRFLELKTAIDNHLTHIQGFRVGEVEIAIYLFGQTESNTIEGIKTLSVET